MNEIEVLDISRDAIFTLLKVVTPVLLVALFRFNHRYFPGFDANSGNDAGFRPQDYRRICNHHPPVSLYA